MKHLLLSVLIFSALSCGAQDTLYKVNTKPFLSQNSFLYTPPVQKAKVYLKPVETKSDQSFWQLIASQDGFRYSIKTVKPFGTSILMDNFGTLYAPLKFNPDQPLGLNQNLYLPVVVGLDLIMKSSFHWMHR